MDNPLALLEEFLTPEALAAVERSAEGVPELPKVIALGELQTPEYGNDPSELIKCRFLYRKGILLIIGPTGIGKSSFIMQFMIYLAVGRPLFGIVPGEVYQDKGMRILLIQSENDSGDLAEMRNGVFAGCDDLTVAEKEHALNNILTVTMNDRTGQAFADALEQLVEHEGPFDLVVIDPLHAAIQGDTNSNRDVSDFIRNQITPVIHRHDFGLLIVHHTCKPAKGKERDGWAAGEYAYLGSGAAELPNAARAVLAIRSLGSQSIYELRAGKRGRRLGWEESDGQPSYAKYIAHHGAPGVICWRGATDEEEFLVTSPKAGQVKKAPAPEILNLIRQYPDHNQNWYIQQALPRFGCTSNTIQARITELCADRLAEGRAHGRERLYRVTEAGDASLQGKDLKINWSGILTEEAQ